MTKRLFALSLSLLLCGAAAIAVIATNAVAQAPAPNTPVLLAQAAPPNAPRAGNGRALPRPLPAPADRAARRAAFCQDAYARAAGRFAYLEVRLNLTAAQTGAFARWRDLRLAAAKNRAAECAALPAAAPGRGGGARGNAATPPTPVERLTREETRLQRRLADIQAEGPALEALYTSLSAAQRQTLSQLRARPGLRAAMLGRGNRMFGRGPQDPGMMGGPANGGMNGGMRGPGMMPPRGNPPPPPPQ